MEEGDDTREKSINILLSTKNSAHTYADRLIEFAVALGFDGWLINLEVDAEPEKILILEEFVSYLTQTLHSKLPGSLVIWYDSITIDGSLSWQNQLNASNKPFFDRCDGIFVNYFWLEDYPKLSADVAGDRKYDVYMGVDVFGRGTYGGGQWKAGFCSVTEPNRTEYSVLNLWLWKPSRHVFSNQAVTASLENTVCQSCDRRLLHR
ncbi:cytosolic endo-beta-N-acetylglucosaminidase [Striga asiatica]|uniref:Cytosolic endo-beta-N-acetylglucosaminidase n=1 Tax=Striga asiatica TaxID=4170 RepID=A0A5A7QHV3_STRAF|nr:cytosolic endo-beta-N-acetylglucosaminidase [Striga asiatica]